MGKENILVQCMRYKRRFSCMGKPQDNRVFISHNVQLYCGAKKPHPVKSRRRKHY